MTKRGFWKLKHAIWYIMAQMLFRPSEYGDESTIEACNIMDELYGGKQAMNGPRHLAGNYGTTKLSVRS